MLNITLNKETAVALLHTDGALTVSDFESAAKVIDPFINEAGKLNGIIIHTKSFPGWDSLLALMTHLRFIKEHHRDVACIAFVTDSPIGNIAETLASHFVKARIKEFGFSELEQANEWIAKQVDE